jgi:hypothetical protein
MNIHPVNVHGYHGTLMSKVDSILKNGFQFSQNPWDWLGSGIYFWQDAPIRAREWAKDWSARNGDGEIAVIHAELVLEDCIDMLDVEWNDSLAEMTVEFQEAMQSEPEYAGLKNYREGPHRGRHELDAAFFNYTVAAFAQRDLKVAAIRAAITEGKSLLPDSPLAFKSHVQICILDPALIRKVELIYDGL